MRRRAIKEGTIIKGKECLRGRPDMAGKVKQVDDPAVRPRSVKSVGGSEEHAPAS